jgi:glycopeptide antibiotics resistance protein
MRGFVTVVPLFLAGVAVTLGVGLFLASVLGRQLKCATALAFILIVSTGIILSATLTPLVGALENGTRSTGTCDLGGMGLIPLSELLHVDDRSLNVMLFVPLGVTVGLMAGSKRALGVVVGAIALPFAIETTQMLVPALGRGCEGIDVIDNLTGLVLGATGAILIRRVDGLLGIGCRGRSD